MVQDASDKDKYLSAVASIFTNAALIIAAVDSTYANADFMNQPDIPYFTHRLDTSHKFWFPTPVSNRYWAPLSIDKVSFWGIMLGQFRLGQVRRYRMQILTLDGTHGGTLWQHDEDDTEYKKALNSGVSIDLVAIIGCVVAKDNHSL